MKIHCKYSELLLLPEIKKCLNAKNRNKHPADQITRLVKLYQGHGIRHPIIISNRSGLVVAGEGRCLAAEELGMESFPVDRQDFESEEQEYTFGVADNAIAEWSELDLAGINADLPEIGPFDIDLLGIEDFTLAPEEKGEPKEKKLKECPECGHRF